MIRSFTGAAFRIYCVIRIVEIESAGFYIVTVGRVVKGIWEVQENSEASAERRTKATITCCSSCFQYLVLFICTFDEASLHQSTSNNSTS